VQTPLEIIYSVLAGLPFVLFLANFPLSFFSKKLADKIPKVYLAIMLRGLKAYLSQYIDLSAAEELMLSQLLEVRTYDKKARLTDIGETELYLNFVLSGMLRKYFFRGKEEIITHITPEGSILASGTSFFTKQPSKFIVEAIEPTIVASLNHDNLEKILSSSPKWERAGRLLVQDFFLDKEYWLLDSIRYTPRERFLHLMRERPDLLQRVPQKYLASYLNIKPETFSRLKHLMLSKKKSVPAKK